MPTQKQRPKKQQKFQQYETLIDNIKSLAEIRDQAVTALGKIPKRKATKSQVRERKELQSLIDELNTTIEHFARIAPVYERSHTLQDRFQEEREEFGSASFGAKFIATHAFGTLIGEGESVGDMANRIESSLKRAEQALSSFDSALHDYINASNDYVAASKSGNVGKAEEAQARMRDASYKIVDAKNLFEAEMDNVGEIMQNTEGAFKVSRDFMIDVAATIATAGTNTLILRSTRLASLAQKGKLASLAVRGAVGSAESLASTIIPAWAKGQKLDKWNGIGIAAAFIFAGAPQLRSKLADDAIRRMLTKAEKQAARKARKLLDDAEESFQKLYKREMTPEQFARYLERHAPSIFQQAKRSYEIYHTNLGTRAGASARFTVTLLEGYGKQILGQLREMPASNVITLVKGIGKLRPVPKLAKEGVKTYSGQKTNIDELATRRRSRKRKPTKRS